MYLVLYFLLVYCCWYYCITDSLFRRWMPN